MSSYGAAGFVRGLANSPLGNLSGLMMQKEKMQRFRKQQEQEEQDRAFKQETLSLVQPFIDEGNWEGASKLALGRGDNEIANSLHRKITLGEDRRQFDERQGLASAQFEEQSEQFDERQGLAQSQFEESQSQFNKNLQIRQDQNKRQGEAHALTTAGTERNLNIKSKNDFASELLNVTGGNFQDLLKNPNSLAHVNRIIEKNPKMMQEWLDLPDGRVPIGLSIVNPEGGGEPLVTLDIYNKSTGSVGPATKNATNDPNDSVVTMRLSRFQGMMEKWAGVTKEPKEGKFSIKELDDGTIIKINEKTGKTADVSKTEQQQIRYKRNKINEDLKTLTASPGFMAAMPEGTHEFLRFAQYFSEKAIAGGAEVDGLVGLMGQLWQRRDTIPEIKAYQEASTFDELDAAGSAILSRLTGKGGGSSAPAASQGTPPEGIQQVATTGGGGAPAVDERATMPVRDGGGNPNINLGGPPQGDMLAENMSGKAFDVSQDNPAWYAQQNAEKGLAGAVPQAAPEVQQAQITGLGQSPGTGYDLSTSKTYGYTAEDPPVGTPIGQDNMGLASVVPPPSSGYEQSTSEMMKDHLARTYGEEAKEPDAGLAGVSIDEDSTDDIKRENMASAGFSLENVRNRRKAAQKRSDELDKSIKKLETNLARSNSSLSELRHTPATNYKESPTLKAKRRKEIETEIEEIEAEIKMKREKRREEIEAEIEKINKQLTGLKNSGTSASNVGAR